jgi:trans-aconitate methyltransferase
MRPVNALQSTPDWNAGQYLKFEDERTRAARDLLAQVPLQDARTAVDLGCGPGNSTEILVNQYRGAKVMGLDSSKDMLRQARQRLLQCAFIEGDPANWIPLEPADLLKPFCRLVEIWQTIYNHVLAGPKAIVEWFKGSALRPYLASLDAPAAEDFLAAYTAEIARFYPARHDGQTLLRFPRLFIVAAK